MRLSLPRPFRAWCRQAQVECAPPTGEFSSRFEGGATGSVCCWLNCHLVFLRG
jgi:hypothetical protein